MKPRNAPNEAIERCQKLCTKVYFEQNMRILPRVFVLKGEELNEAEKLEGCKIMARVVIEYTKQKHYPIHITEECLLGECKYLWDTILHEVAHTIHWEQLKGESKLLYFSRNYEQFHDRAWEKVYRKLQRSYTYAW
jgi:hypothetical protein